MSYTLNTGEMAVRLEGQITQDMADAMEAAVRIYNPSVVVINTQGGSVMAATRIAKLVGERTCVVDGSAFSAGFFILQQCKTRLMTVGSKVMVHEAVALGAGSAEEHLATAIKLTTMNDAMALIQCARMTISVEECRGHYRGKTGSEGWFMRADEALEVGAVDGVLGNFSG
jgi:ATP-dependent protease ClpP protease subunit